MIADLDRPLLVLSRLDEKNNIEITHRDFYDVQGFINLARNGKGDSLEKAFVRRISEHVSLATVLDAVK